MGPRNKLKLNPNKMAVLVVGPCSYLGSGDTVVLDVVALPLKDQVCSLVVLLDLVLMFDKQVMSVALAGTSAATLPRSEGPCFCYTLRLDYCNTRYMGLPLVLFNCGKQKKVNLWVTIVDSLYCCYSCHLG